jgi:hypothetical protein
VILASAAATAVGILLAGSAAYASGYFGGYGYYGPPPIYYCGGHPAPYFVPYPPCYRCGFYYGNGPHGPYKHNDHSGYGYSLNRPWWYSY